MDQLAHNALIKIIGEPRDTLYRVLLDEPAKGKTVLIEIIDRTEDSPSPSPRGGRRRKVHNQGNQLRRKKSPLPTMTTPTWFDRAELEKLDAQHLLLRVDAELEAGYFVLPFTPKRKTEYERRCQIAAPFLSYGTLREELLVSGSFASLITGAIAAGCSKALAYKIPSLLCRFGFSERSLRDRRFNCGARGVKRPCVPGIRKKSGRKTALERMARQHGEDPPCEQPGMTEDWRNKIMAADAKLSKLKMKMPERVDRILASSFVTQFKFVDGKPAAIEMPMGSYPNRRQIQRVIKNEIPRLTELQQKTTKGHFNRNLRGLRGKMWKQIPGPGHTWCIDSTVGDIYLRSTIERSWIVGRPVVYAVVDAWSTAVVGFHVCLQNPSWNVAKVALFNCVAPPALLGDLFGFTVSLALDPLPTLPASLWMDNGEYRSKAGRVFGMHVPDESFTPPYRPDWHGVVEVLHRIGKDNIQAIPGAIDKRRKELELRQYRPGRSVMTLPEFVEYLYVVFSNYNLTANREHRLDATMKACGVFGSPAGLWRFGHSMGIGTQRAFTQASLTADLLPHDRARVTRNGIYRAGLDYGWPSGLEEQWSTIARSPSGGWNIQTNYHPSGVSKIWTPNATPVGMLELSLQDTAIAPRDATLFDHLDVLRYQDQRRGENEHLRNLLRVQSENQRKQLRDNAIDLTREADAAARGSRPSITVARDVELFPSQGVALSSVEIPPKENLPDNGLDDHLAFMAQLSAEMNKEHWNE
ncbi:hypothetical protein GCM10027046_32080 [Uliginosibacterium flavum]|uniref:Integrase catalytic domain-containing protein n=1 Tax=Uliginosibacterium flavum TaxID=1396831 RepID=A0ABV2TQ75_9RHOO